MSYCGHANNFVDQFVSGNVSSLVNVVFEYVIEGVSGLINAVCRYVIASVTGSKGADWDLIPKGE